MIIVLGEVAIPAGTVEKARDAIAKMVAETHKEAGCIAYSFAQDIVDPGTMHIVEKWQDAAALQAHFATPHMAEFQQAIGTTGAEIRQVRMFETDEGQPLG